MTKEEILSYLKEHKCYSAEKSFRKRFPTEYAEILSLEFPIAKRHYFSDTFYTVYDCGYILYKYLK